jgi:hypothetical protein
MKNKIAFSMMLLVLVAVTVQTASAQDELLFRKRILSSTWNSFLYGDAVVVISEAKGAAAVGIPVVSAGIGALVPLLTNESRPITTNQLMLTNHGQTIGWAHGFALSMLIFGDSLFAENSNNYKVAVGLGAATSIGLGFLGKSLGKNKDWSEGQVALYRHYGWVGPMTASCLGFAFVDDPRVFGGTILLGGAGGYLLANQVNNWHEYTRGDIRATQALTVMNGALGTCIMLDVLSEEWEFKRSEWLIPAAGLISGTALSHLWLKNVNLTPRQGMTTIYAASGGAILGAGIAMIIGSDDFTLDYAIPYATSLGAYAFAVESLRKKNNNQAFFQDKKGGNRWDFAFMPYNLMLNNKLEKSGCMINGRTVQMQPLFAASVTF